MTDRKARTFLTPTQLKDAYVYYLRHGAKKCAERFNISKTTVSRLKEKLEKLGIKTGPLQKQGARKRAKPTSSRSRARNMTTAEKKEVAKYTAAHGAADAAKRFKISKATCSRWMKEWRDGIPFGATSNPDASKRAEAKRKAKAKQANGRDDDPVHESSNGADKDEERVVVAAPYPMNEDQVACMKLCLGALAELEPNQRPAVIAALSVVRDSGIINWLPEAVEE